MINFLTLIQVVGGDDERSSHHDELNVILNHICFVQAFQSIFYHRIIIICDEIFHERIIEANCNFSYSISIRKFKNQSAHKDVHKMFMDIIAEDKTYSAFQLLGPPEMISLIFDVSKKIGLSGPNYTWILPSNAFVFVEVFNEPSRFLLLQRNKLSFSLNIHSDIKTNLLCEGFCREKLYSSNHTLFTIRTRNEQGNLVTIGSIVNPNSQDFYKLESNQLLTRLFPTFYFNTGGGGSGGDKVRLKIVTILDPPFTIVKSDSISNTCDVGHLCWVYQQPTPASPSQQDTLVGKCCVGFCIDLLELLKYDLNFDADLYIVKDSVYGDKVNNTWVGMVGDVVHGKADLVLAALTINAQRSKVIDYTGPYMVGGVAIATMVEKTMFPFVNLEAFKPLTGKMWFVTLMIMFVASVLFLITERIVDTKAMNNRHPAAAQYQRSTYNFRQSFLYIGGLAFQRDIGGEQPIYLGSRVIAIAIAAALLVIMSSYTAVLTANKVTHKTKLPIVGFKDQKVSLSFIVFFNV